MNEFHNGLSDLRVFGARLFVVACALMVAVASSVVGPTPAMAQMEYDYNGDGEVHCDDFEEQFPETYTDEATEALEQYPDELSDLNNDPEQDDIACEGQPGSEEPADRESADREPGDGEPAERDRTAQPPAPAPDTETPEATTTEPETTPTEMGDVPADVMERVEGCAVVAISSRDVVGAGCPGVGTVTFRIPDDAPSMQGTVLMNPGTPPAADATAAQEATAATRSSGSNQDDANRAQADDEQNAAKADKDEKRQSADNDKANKDKTRANKNTDKKKDGKSKDKKPKDKKKDGNSKGKKNGKKSRKR